MEYNDDIGGRVKHTTFGQKPHGSGPYVIELGANWIHGIGKNNGQDERRNPSYQLALNDGLEYANFTERNITGYTDDGRHFNVSGLSDQFDVAQTAAYEPMFPGEATGEKDISLRGALRRAGWNPEGDPDAQAAEVFSFDFSYAVSPDVVSTFGSFGEAVRHISPVKASILVMLTKNTGRSIF